MRITPEISIYLPSTVDVDKQDIKKVFEVQKYIKTQLAKRYGGFSAYPIQGGWVSDEHGLVEENVLKVSAKVFEYDEWPNEVSFMQELAQYVKEELSQECVLIEYDYTGCAELVGF